eukprot:5479194-Amphidinium_carterae.1
MGVILPLLSNRQLAKIHAMDGRIARSVLQAPSGYSTTACVLEAGLRPLRVAATLRQHRLFLLTQCLPTEHHVRKYLKVPARPVLAWQGPGWLAE